MSNLPKIWYLNQNTFGKGLRLFYLDEERFFMANYQDIDLYNEGLTSLSPCTLFLDQKVES